MNTITETQYKLILERLINYSENTNAPDFWTLDTLDARGEQCDWNEAVYLSFSVQDFDYKHDLDFVRLTLNVHGVEIDESDMLTFIDLNQLEREGEERPLKAALIDGSGILGRVYGYELILKR